MQLVVEDGSELASMRFYNRALASALAGLAGGAAMLGTWLVTFASAGKAPWRPLQLTASAVLGDSALLPSAGFGTALLGLGVHVAISMALGLLFGILARSRRTGQLVLQGIVFGLILGAFLHGLLLPNGVSLAWALRMPLEASLLAHAVFGIVTALVLLPIERTLITKEFEERARHPVAVGAVEYPSSQDGRADSAA